MYMDEIRSVYETYVRIRKRQDGQETLLLPSSIFRKAQITRIHQKPQKEDGTEDQGQEAIASGRGKKEGWIRRLRWSFFSGNDTQAD